MANYWLSLKKLNESNAIEISELDFPEIVIPEGFILQFPPIFFKEKFDIDDLPTFKWKK